MDYQHQSINKKWQRHFRGKKTAISIGLMILGLCLIFPLAIIWPQYYSAYVFNSRLGYHLIIDFEDFLTCSKDYKSFVFTEPSEETDLVSIYLYNVTNAAGVFEQGYKPNVAQVGPFGFKKYTYKYDITFNDDSTTLSFKEYNVLSDVDDLTVCKRMYYRMDRAYVSLASDPCPGSSCDCLSSNLALTIINPLFIKLMNKETPFSILSYYATDVFSKVKALIEDEFPTATRAHLVSVAFQEIYIFRLQMQIGQLLNASYQNLLPSYPQTKMVSIMDNYNASFKQPTACGLSKYGISTCPFFQLSILIKNRKGRSNFNGTVYYPSVKPFFDSTSNISFLNTDYGLPQWIALMFYKGYTDLGFDGGYSAIYGDSLRVLYNNFTQTLSEYSYSSSNISPLSEGALTGSTIIIDAAIQYLAETFLLPYLAVCKSLVYEEFNSYPSTVPCDPLGRKCAWTWGYVREVNPGQANHNLSTSMIFSLIDQLSKVDSNPNNIQYDGNTLAIYNSYSFCSAYNNTFSYDTSNSKCFATNLSYTVSDAMTGNPAGLWGIDNGGISGLNISYLHSLFNDQTFQTREYYFHFACNISALLHQYYRTVTDFHDHYVISYLNKNKDPTLKHTFSLSRSTKWKEIGWAQWGGGYITDAIVGVRAIYQIRRDGMWYFGPYDYYSNLIEYSSWAIVSGFPNAYINDVFAVQVILSYLADASSDGINFRNFLSYISSTYIGNGVNYIRGVGAIGDKTFIAESNAGNFSCPGQVYSMACDTLNTFHSSSGYQCDQVQALFTTCRTLYFQNNKFVTNCDRFETSLTARLNGIVCDHVQVYGHKHNYTKSVGNIVHAMIYGLTRRLHLTDGLWCTSSDYCNYELGGMFTTVTPAKLLFEGFTDASVLGYLNRKFSKNLHFSCVTAPYDVCGVENLQCDDEGYILTTYHSITGNAVEKYLFKYNITDYFLYFAESLVVSYDGKLSWNSTQVSNNISSVSFMNPIWAVYPAWKLSSTKTNSLNLLSPSTTYRQENQVRFLKDLQCQQRIYSGKGNLFSSCVDTLYTGGNLFNQTSEATKFRGNHTIIHFNSNTNQTMNVNGSINTGSQIQYPAGLWPGFLSYPYLFQGSSAGKSYSNIQDVRFFDTHHALSFDLSQAELLYQYQRDISIYYPLAATFDNSSTYTSSLSLPVRRFTETVETWNSLHTLGKPSDSYGMPYKIPIGMASLERLADMPLYIGTPHAYGNLLWGGTEYSHVTGYLPDRLAQYTYADYDPVTGRSLRQGVRQQIHVRVEANVLFPLIFQSQSRCVPPTKLFSAGTGYGCFSYIPLLWIEDATLMSQEDFTRLHDHYYRRPQRAYVIMIIGVTIGVVLMLMGTCLFLNETYQRRKFKNRVYVD